MPQEAVPLLRKWLIRKLETEPGAWFNAQSAAIANDAGDANEATLDIALGLVPRRLGKGSLGLTAVDLAEADSAVKGWRPVAWSVSDAARILLLCEMRPGKKTFAERFRSLCQTADAAELVTLYRGLPLYPTPEALQAQVGEGLRSNMRVVFEAIAHHSPFPQTHFDLHRWNHMVLKALFTDSPLAPIQGLDARANAELARIMCDFAHERWAAGRRVPVEIWRCVGPFAEGAMVNDLARVLASGDATERRAAAIALTASPDPRAAQILQTAPELKAEVASGKLDWATL